MLPPVFTEFAKEARTKHLNEQVEGLLVVSLKELYIAVGEKGMQDQQSIHQHNPSRAGKVYR